MSFEKWISLWSLVLQFKKKSVDVERIKKTKGVMQHKRSSKKQRLHTSAHDS